MQSFDMGRFDSDEPWFRVGSVNVGTTVLVSALATFSYIIFAFEKSGGPIFRLLEMNTDKVLGAQLWRLVTWPIPNVPDIWGFLGIVLFFLFGADLERLMGRRKYTIYLAAMTVLPALAMTVYGALLGHEVFRGIRFVEIGVLIGIVAARPGMRFLFNIPGWVVPTVIVGIEFLRNTGVNVFWLNVLLLSSAAVALLGIRAMGYAESVQWVPKIPLPPSLGGDPYGKSGSPRAATKTRKTKPRGRGKLSAVPATNPDSDSLDEAAVDALLDQVAEGGLDSLTKAQRKQLEEHSRRMRKRKSD